MCKRFSAIVSKTDQLYFLPEYTDSHELLIAHFQLNEGRAAQNFIRLEFTEPENGNPLDIDSYVLAVDEANIPDWFTDERKEKTISKLVKIIKAMIVTDDRKALIGGCHILGDGANIGRLVNCRIAAMGGNAVVEIAEQSTRIDYVRDSATINYVGGSATINYVRGSATIKDVGGSATIKDVRGSATIKDVRGSATIKDVRDSATINYVRDSATINYVRDSATINYVRDSATINYVRDSATINYVGGSATIKDVGGSATINYVRDSATIYYVGGSAKIVKDSRVK
jgi:hypothetical protein